MLLFFLQEHQHLLTFSNIMHKPPGHPFVFNSVSTNQATICVDARHLARSQKQQRPRGAALTQQFSAASFTGSLLCEAGFRVTERSSEHGGSLLHLKLSVAHDARHTPASTPHAHRVGCDTTSYNSALTSDTEI
jgi:hypothetical protein